MFHLDWLFQDMLAMVAAPDAFNTPQVARLQAWLHCMLLQG